MHERTPHNHAPFMIITVGLPILRPLRIIFARSWVRVCYPLLVCAQTSRYRASTREKARLPTHCVCEQTSMETHQMTDLFSWTKSINTKSADKNADLLPAPPIKLSRTQVVDQIISINTSATADYLEQFEQKSLDTYLDHLISAQQPRGRHARWDRPGDTPAMMSRRRVV